MGNTKTIRMSDGTRSDSFAPYREGHVDVTVSVPVGSFQESYEQAMEQGWLDLGVARSMGWDNEDDLRVAYATFTAVAEAMPMLTTDFTYWLLHTGCNGNIRHCAKQWFDLAEREEA